MYCAFSVVGHTGKCIEETELHLIKFGLKFLQFLYRSVDMITMIPVNKASAASDHMPNLGEKGQATAVASADGRQVGVYLFFELRGGAEWCKTQTWNIRRITTTKIKNLINVFILAECARVIYTRSTK